MRLYRLPQQLIPLIFIAIIGILALVIARSILVPDSFGKYGHYRANAVDEIAKHEVSYAGYQACAECHDDIFQIKQQSHHKGVACEVCHGAAAQHANAPDEAKPTIPQSRGFCPLCHGYNPSRPSGFPQILADQHNPGKACITCHNPHNPLLPHTPEECSACHREIANLKAVSPHTTLLCTRCHSVPSEHLTNPKFALAGKPGDRQLCGECHSKDAGSSSEIPKIDMNTHGERYLCWDCHYPHYPEAKS